MSIGGVLLRLSSGFRHYQGSPNPKYQDVTRELWRKAGLTIRIVAGELDPFFYTNPNTLQILEAAIKRGVIIEVIHGPAVSEKSKEALAALGISLYGRSSRPAVHFSVVDGKHARVEEPHVGGEQEGRHQYIKYDTAFLGASLEAHFAELKAEAKEERHEP